MESGVGHEVPEIVCARARLLALAGQLAPSQLQGGVVQLVAFRRHVAEET